MERRTERGLRLPQEASPERRGSARFLLSLEVRYNQLHRRVVVATGSGHTIDVSSSGLRFTADRPLRTGLRLEVSMDWPVPLDGSVQLQLVISGLIVRTTGTETAMRIDHYEFRTRGLGLPVASRPEWVG
jgi:hypothetical protein